MLRASGSSAYALYAGRTAAVSGDYNAYVLENGARAVLREDTPFSISYAGLADWVAYSGEEAHSLVGDPGMADAQTGDFHLQTQHPAGRYIPETGGWTQDVATSRLLDAGVGAYAAEGMPNGARANIGLYGNSAWASRTATNARIELISYADGGIASGLCELNWVAAGQATGHTFSIEYSDDGGVSWSNLAVGVAGASGQYSWNTTDLGTRVLSLWRMTDENDSDVADSAETLFSVRNGPAFYYVNDDVLDGDVYTTAAGSPFQDGTRPDKPKDSVQAILDAYDLEPGDCIYVDTGTYALPVSMGQQDAGTAGAPVLLQGSTNEVAGGTLFLAGINVKQSAGTTLKNLRFRGVSTAITFSDYSSSGLCEWIDVQGGGTAFSAVGSQVSLTLKHCVARETSVRGIYAQSSADVSADHCVLWNTSRGVEVNSAICRISNSVVGVSGDNHYAYYLGSSGSIIGDYNDIIATNQAIIAYRQTSRLPHYFQTLSEWVAETGYESHSLVVNPGFVDAAQGDFHLLSQQAFGRYDTVAESWVKDSETSHLIDAGTGMYAVEPEPHGGAANIGLFGNSAVASRTPTNGWLQVMALNDGGRVEGTCALSWTVGGNAVSEHCCLEFSADGGASWVTLATNIVASDRTYAWNTTRNISTVRGRWRISSESDPTIMDTSDELFVVHNVPLQLYVNDAYDPAVDVYTTAAGSAENPGDSPAEPQSSIQYLLDTYDLEPGDTIFVDTGTNREQIVWDFFDAGSTALAVTLQGSTNEAAGGTHMLGNIRLTEAPYVQIRHFTMAGSGTAVTFSDYSDGGTCEWIRILGGATGIEVNRSTGISVGHCVLKGQSVRGVYAVGTGSMSLRNSIVASCPRAVENNGGSIMLRNNVLIAEGSTASIYYLQNGTVSADYNELVLRSGAMAGYRSASPIPIRYDSLGGWVQNMGQDLHSLAVQPLFVDEAGNDYHLQDHSPLIDAGSPLDSFAQEPVPNGGRINVGVYGNTPEAAVTPPEAAAVAISYADGGVAKGVVELRWNSRNVAMVTLRYSANGGSSWQTLATGVVATAESWSWNTQTGVSSAAGLWQIVDEDSAQVLAQTEQYFSVRNEPLRFYVNDASREQDVYCSAAGAISNLGVSAMAPNSSLAGLFAAFDLIEGDTVLVDTGLYPLSEPVRIDYFDRGTPTNPVQVVGSTNGSVFTGGSIELQDAQAITLRMLRLSGGGVRVVDSYYANLDQLVLSSNAVAVYLQNSPYAAVHHSIFKENELGVSVNYASGSRLYNNTFVSNTSYCIQGDNRSGVVVENSVFQLAPEKWVYFRAEQYSVDYNLYDFPSELRLSYKNGAYPSYTNLGSWQVNRKKDYRSAVAPALFATNGADYHLQSSAGTYGSGLWTLYPGTSTGVDLGNPGISYASETSPNGQRINAGAYGDTDQASRGGTNTVLVINSPQGGAEINEVLWPLLWRANRLLVSNSQMNVEYSDDDGVSWQLISTVNADTEYVQWQVPVNLTGKTIRWRLQDVATTGAVYAVTNSGGVFVLLDYADLALSMSRMSEEDSVLYATNRFVISVTNHGPGDASGIYVQDVLTNGLSYLSHTSDAPYDPESGVWDIGSLLSGESSRLTLQAVVTQTLVTVTNDARLLSGYQPWDPVTNNHVAVTSFVIAAAADVGISLGVDQSDGLTNNQSVVLTVRVLNAGPDSSTNVQVRDLLPIGLRYDRHLGGVYSAESGIWQLGELSRNGYAALTLNATIITSGVVIANSAQVLTEGRTYDPYLANDQGSVALNVGTVPYITVLGTNHLPIANGDFSPSRVDGTDFGAVYTRFDSRLHTFVITNSGDGVLYISNITVRGAGADFSTSGEYPQIVSVGNSCDLTIMFDPIQSGGRTAQVDILNNAVSPYTFGVSGVGVAQAEIKVLGENGALIANHAEAATELGTAFGGVSILSAVTNMLIITNSGDAALLLGCELSDATGFDLPGAPVNVPAGGESRLRIVFNPHQSTEYTAMVTITNNSLVSPYSFDLSGQGSLETISVNLMGIESVETGVQLMWQGPLGLYFDVDQAGLLCRSNFVWQPLVRSCCMVPYVTNSVLSNQYGFRYTDTTSSSTNGRAYRISATNSFDLP